MQRVLPGRSTRPRGRLVMGLVGAGIVLMASGSLPGAPLDPQKLAELDKAIYGAMAAKELPGGVLWVERQGQRYVKAFGDRAVEPVVEPMTTNTIFDAASLTKVIATTPSILILKERGLLKLEDRVRDFIPEFRGEGTADITIRHLLTHTSGLRPGLSARPEWTGYDTAIHLACLERAQKPPGTEFRYSDINFILLGEIVRRVSERPLNVFAAWEIFGPLEMRQTGFLPGEEILGNIAPTERTEEGVLRGVVHDPTSRRMGGVAGHAGLFTTAGDLARFARMMLNEGTLDGTRLFRPETVRLMASVQSPEPVHARRGLGWDIDSPYSGPRGDLFPRGSYGHTGWTGASIWIDPFSRTFVIFLSNRNHPTEEGSVIRLRKELGTLAARAVTDFEFAGLGLPEREPIASAPPRKAPDVPPRVLNGIDVLAQRNFDPLKKRKVGLITNHTGVDRRRRPTLDILREREDLELKALFSPEHGLHGRLDEKVQDGRDEHSGLPIFSLYGDRKKPAPDQLAGLDTLVFDIQDIGCRFYTYIATMGLCMEAAAESGLEFIVLDRVNPINGVTVEGPVYQGESTFVAFHPIALRHGMTVGELALMFAEEKRLSLQLNVIPLQGWRRAMWFDQTGLPWVNPSPNMRNLKEAILYPGVGLLERAISVGRGTDTPFEVMGAPFLDDLYLADQLNAMRLPGVRLVPVQFQPAGSLYAGELCRGAYLFLEDREIFSSVDLGLAAAWVAHRTFAPPFSLEKVNELLLDPEVLDGLRMGKPLDEIKQGWAKDLETFQERRRRYLIYQ